MSYSIAIHYSYKSATPWNIISCCHIEVAGRESDLPTVLSHENLFPQVAFVKETTVLLVLVKSINCQQICTQLHHLLLLIQLVFNVPIFYHLCHPNFNKWNHVLCFQSFFGVFIKSRGKSLNNWHSSSLISLVKHINALVYIVYFMNSATYFDPKHVCDK